MKYICAESEKCKLIIGDKEMISNTYTNNDHLIWQYSQKLCMDTEKVWTEKRIEFIKKTIKRYLDNGEVIPVSWIKEYNKHKQYINNFK